MLMLYFLSLFLVVNAVESFRVNLREEFEMFKQKHDKIYSNQVEEEFRMKIFANNYKRIARHNRRYEKGRVGFNMEINRFADLTHHEFVSTYTGLKVSEESITSGSVFLRPNGLEAPDEVDWRTEGYVTEVKDQGDCGSCWAFSSTGALEGQHFKKAGILVSLSEQNLMDCSAKYNNHGCGGGLMSRAFAYIRDNGGIDTEESYPYTSYEGNCRFSEENVGATDTGYQRTKSGDEDDLLAAVASVGPITVCIDVSYRFKYYQSGVFFGDECGNKLENLNHAVLVVGYGNDTIWGEYWLVKNSWGADWGDKGYIKMSKNSNNNCGIATLATFPLV